MSKIEELIKRHCPDGVNFYPLGEVCTVVRGASPRPIKNFITEEKDGVNWIKIGDVAVGSKYITSCAERITKEGAKKSRFVKKGDFILSNSMSFGRPYILEINGCIHDGWLAISDFEDKMLADYLYYVLVSGNIQREMEHRASFGGAVQNLNADIVRALEIPVPPIEVQEEIVRILDKFTELEAELQAELNVRKKQYEYYRDLLFSFDTDTRFGRIGDIAVVTKLAGFEFTEYVNYVESGKIIALRGLNVKKGKLDLTDVKYIDGSELSKLTRSKLKIGDMLFTYVGTVGEVALIDEDNKFYLAPNVAMIRLITDDVIPEFMMYYFQTNQFWNSQINKLLQSSSMKNIPMEKIRKFMIPIPSIVEQKHIVEIIKKFDEIATDVKNGLPAEIEARHKQYEYYRDKLLTFERKVV